MSKNVSLIFLTSMFALPVHSAPQDALQLTWNKVGATIVAELAQQENVLRLVRCMEKLHESFTEREARNVMVLHAIKERIDGEGLSIYRDVKSSPENLQLLESFKENRFKSNGIAKKLAKKYEEALTQFVRLTKPPSTKESEYDYFEKNPLHGLERSINRYRFDFEFEGKRMFLILWHRGLMNLFYGELEHEEMHSLPGEIQQVNVRKLFTPDSVWPDGRKLQDVDLPDIGFVVLNLEVSSQDRFHVTARVAHDLRYDYIQFGVWQYLKRVSETQVVSDDVLNTPLKIRSPFAGEKFSPIKAPRRLLNDAQPQPPAQIEKVKDPEFETD